MRHRLLFPVAGFCLLSQLALAQTVPDAGSLLRENERRPQSIPTPAPQAVPQVPASRPKDGLRITVKAFKLVGNTLLDEPTLQAVLAPWIGKEAGFSELQQAANAIAEEYRRRGWFARTQLPEQDISAGIITINILEGKLGAVQIDDQGTSLRISRDYVSNTMTARQQPGDALNLDNLERSTSLLNDTPGVAVATILAPGQQAGQTDAIIKVKDKPLFSGTASLDNTGARSTGEDKFSFGANLDNPFGIGDQIVLDGNTTRGNDYLKLGYSRPVGHDGLRVGVSTSAMQYRLLGELASLQARGDAQTYGVNAFYSLLRSGMRNISLSLAVDRKDYYNEANGTATSEKRLHTGVLSLSGDQLDGLGKGGLTLGGINLTRGHVDLAANATNEHADQIGPRTAGDYTKLGYNLARLQKLNDTLTLWASFNGQYAGKNLDSSEKLSLGGPAGVRAYPVLEGTGDDGWLSTLELRYNLLPQLQLSGFYDHGWIRQSHDASYTGSPLVNTGSLEGSGLALSYSQAGKFTLRATWARRIGDNPFANTLNGKDSDGSLDRDRLWLSAVVFL